MHDIQKTPIYANSKRCTPKAAVQCQKGIPRVMRATDIACNYLRATVYHILGWSRERYAPLSPVHALEDERVGGGT